MRAIRAASTALLGAAALALAAPTAVAADGAPAPNPRAPRAKAPGDFVVSPSLVAPGGRVTLSAPGCASTATASAGIFDTVTIAPNSAATATVDWDARRGAVYTVSFNCTGGISDTVNLTISGTPTATPTISSTVLTPPRGVRGGLGGAMGGVEPLELAAGGALVLAAVAGGVYVVRRRTGAARRH
ncbi:hypothetical protein [Streptomyces venezuelae]|uniref:hypothetical protein n=1 Tax=Streptomyces venezuelae TaxID=54571 RepID=UPI00090205A5|nr:hypothetical protein [Streptomyces venezuelae]APE25492.1 hypothetical protein vnz_33655 [Streptomyces venezuelae]QES02831.1 hypothetical protein DEJ43_34205 [Streptomyces venezuelae ATCC 10712]